MAYRPEDRYASPRTLAHDLELWLADEPVSAWPEPARLKLRRWVNRNRTLVSSAAAAILVAAVTGGYLAYEVHMEPGPPPDRGRRPGGRALDGRGPLGAADRRPARCGPRRSSGSGCIPWLAAGDVRRPASGRRWHCFPTTRSQAQCLFDRLVKPEATPEEVLVIRDGLLRNNALEPFVEPLIAGLRPPLGAAQRRRDCGGSACWPLARPGWSRWPEFAGRIAARLVQVNPFEIAAWREVFQPIEHRARSTAAGDLCRPLRARAAGPGLLAASGIRVAGRTISTGPRRWPDCWPTPTRTSSGRSFAACPRRRIGSGPSP